MSIYFPNFETCQCGTCEDCEYRQLDAERDRAEGEWLWRTQDR